MSSPTQACPECSGPSTVVTAVTIVTLGSDPRTVLVTRLCQSVGCHLKFTVSKTEDRLSDAERAAWCLQ